MKIIVEREFIIKLFFTIVLNLLIVNNVYAHDWESWHWDKGGETIEIMIQNTASNFTAANNAIKNWNDNTILSLPTVSYHTDIGIYDGNYGTTGWAGLASIEQYIGDHIQHGHAYLNTYYNLSQNYKQGVFCQEIGHLFGLGHSETGDCMGLGYYSSTTYYVGQQI